MTSDSVTRDELKSIIEIQSKNVEQLTIIANHLSTIVDRENKIYERLYNGLAKDISNAVNDRLYKIEACLEDAREKRVATNQQLKTEFSAVLSNSTLSKDMGHIKWFISIVGVLIVVTSVLMNVIVRKGAEEIQESQFHKIQDLVEGNAKAISFNRSAIINKHDGEQNG